MSIAIHSIKGLELLRSIGVNTEWFAYISHPAEGLILVLENNWTGSGKYFYIKYDGFRAFPIPVFFDSASDFENGRAKVGLKGEEFFIGIDGERID